LKKLGDVVGMTMASEATLCMEYAIPYVSLCSIDNYANGILKTPLAMGEVEEQIIRNMAAVETVLHSVLSEGF
jgi:5'-methylthioadenosine phosphorylase